MLIKHKKTSTKAAPTDPTIIGGPDWNDDHAIVPLVWVEKTLDYTLLLTDLNNGVSMNKATAINLTVPLAATLYQNVNSVITQVMPGDSVLIDAKGAGAVTIVPAVGVTIRKRSVFSYQSAGQNALVVLVYRDVNEWLLSGDLALL